MLCNPTFRSLTLTAKAFRSKLRSCTRWFATPDGGLKDGSGPEQVSARCAGTVSVLPAANVELALNRSKPVEAIGQLQRYCHQLSMDRLRASVRSCLYRPTFRGQAHLAARKARKPPLSSRRSSTTGALSGTAWTGAHASRLQGLLTICKGASPDIPIHKQAKAE